MIEYIEYEGKIHKIVWVKIEGREEPIGTESLENELLPDGRSFRDDRAREIDEYIFYYVPDNMIESPDLGDYVTNAIN